MKLLVNLFSHLFGKYVSNQLKKCAKCNKQVLESETRTYHLALKNNIRRDSWLAKADQIILCIPCDSRRKTNLVQYLS